MKTGIFPGSFNPVHAGHVRLAEHLLENTDLDRILLLLTPQNPLKRNADLLDDNLRLEMLRLSLAGKTGLEACDVELSLPKPSYTVNTLRRLTEMLPDDEISLIIGADNLAIFDRWRDFQYILDHYRLIVYPRGGDDVPADKFRGNISIVSAPLLDVSSSMIREKIRNGGDVSPWLHPDVLNFINEKKLYR